MWWARRAAPIALAVSFSPALSAGCAAHTSTPATTTTQPPVAAPTVTTAVAPAPPPPRVVTWVDLQVGDCLQDPPPTDPGIATVSVVDCAIAHHAEVYLRAPVEVNLAVADVADHQCTVAFPKYTGRSVSGSGFAVSYLIDSNQDRTSDNPLPSTVICLLQPTDGQPRTTSARH